MNADNAPTMLELMPAIVQNSRSLEFPYELQRSNVVRNPATVTTRAAPAPNRNDAEFQTGGGDPKHW